MPTTPPPLTLEQQIAKLRFEALIADLPAADAVYDQLPETKGGRIISTDFARFLDERYRIHVPGKLRDLIPSWEGAWLYAQARLEREICSARERGLLRMMAGGWAAGKTFALERATVAELSWDGTLADAKWSRHIIELALAHGWRVQVAYVHRPIELALRGALERGVSEGRMVPLLQLPVVHAQVQKAVVALELQFRSEGQVDFLLLHNPGTREHPQEVSRLKISDIAPRGWVHYSPRDVEAFQQTARQIWQQASDDPAFPAEVAATAGIGMA